MKEQTSITTNREPAVASNTARPVRRSPGHTYVVPDAAMPGPIARFHPIDGSTEEDDASSGGDAMGDHDAQNSDRI